MKYAVRTKSGSLYLIDYDKKTWSRPEHSDESLFVRTDEGELWNNPLITVGQPMILTGPPIDKGAVWRQITTTEVISIEEVREKDTVKND